MYLNEIRTYYEMEIEVWEGEEPYDAEYPRKPTMDEALDYLRKRFAGYRVMDCAEIYPTLYKGNHGRVLSYCFRKAEGDDPDHYGADVHVYRIQSEQVYQPLELTDDSTVHDQD